MSIYQRYRTQYYDIEEIKVRQRPKYNFMQNNYGVSRWWVNRYDINLKYRWINSYSYWHWQIKFDTISKLPGISIYLKIPFKNVKWLQLLTHANRYRYDFVDIDKILSTSKRMQNNIVGNNVLISWKDVWQWWNDIDKISISILHRDLDITHFLCSMSTC